MMCITVGNVSAYTFQFEANRGSSKDNGRRVKGKVRGRSGSVLHYGLHCVGFCLSL